VVANIVPAWCVRANGGQILVSSAKNHGSTFAMQFPFFPATSSSNPFQLPPISTPALERPGLLPGLHIPQRNKQNALAVTVPGAASMIAPSYFSFVPTSTPAATSSSSSSTPLSSGSTPYSPLRQQRARSPSFFPRMERLVVLIADDNAINIRVLENRVRKMGHVVQVSMDGQECFDKFVQNCHSIDFILMDINVSTILVLPIVHTDPSFAYADAHSRWIRVHPSYPHL
jgi:hypothetical protein